MFEPVALVMFFLRTSIADNLKRVIRVHFNVNSFGLQGRDPTKILSLELDG